MSNARNFANLLGTSTTVPSSSISGGGIVKEQLAMICDGQNYTVSSGTYTPTNVTAAQALTTSYATVTGSELSYTPPSGTTCVVYDFTLQFAFYDAQGIGHFKFFIMFEYLIRNIDRSYDYQSQCHKDSASRNN